MLLLDYLYKLIRHKETPKAYIHHVHHMLRQNQTYDVKRYMLYSVLLGVCLFFGTFTWLASLGHIQVAIQTSLFRSMLVWVFILSAWWLKETVTVLKVAALLLCLGGVALVAYGNYEQDTSTSRKDDILGYVLILTSALLNALYFFLKFIFYLLLFFFFFFFADVVNQISALCRTTTPRNTTEQVIKGWDLGVASMNKGEKSLLICKSEYAYGESGAGADIPPNATLQFEVELLGWDDPDPETTEERIQAAEKRKASGNDFFKESKFDEALEQYQSALNLFAQSWGLTDEQRQEIDKLKLPLLLNEAQCHLKLKRHKDAILSCHKALDIDTNNIKALYRRGLAYSAESEFDKATSDFNECLRYEPDNKQVKLELQKLKKAEQRYKQKEKAVYQNMFK